VTTYVAYKGETVTSYLVFGDRYPGNLFGHRYRRIRRIGKRTWKDKIEKSSGPSVIFFFHMCVIRNDSTRVKVRSGLTPFLELDTVFLRTSVSPTSFLRVSVSALIS
jgi:hypothetical protein